MRFDLGRMARVMRLFGQPQDAYPSIHIAGTNGKGSVAAFTTQALIDAGYKVGTYTSPHLVRMTERFKINGKEIERRRLDGILARVASKFRRATQFELLTAAAFIYFAEEKIDIAVVEVGLGGRLDATNVLRRVLVSVITNIDIDHTEYLGRTVEKIAAEKAGIIKPFVPVITGATGSARRVIESVAASEQSEISVPPSRRYKLKLRGAYQQQNAALAHAALRASGLPLSDTQILRSLSKTVWAGRFEKIGNVYLDGAHNPAGARALAQTVKKLLKKRVTLIFGVMKDKKITEMIRSLEPISRRVFVAPVTSDRTADPMAVAALKQWNHKAAAFASASVALGAAQLLKDPIVVAGSLYLVGEVRNILTSSSPRKRGPGF